MASVDDVARGATALGERANALSCSLEAEYRELFATMDRVQRTFSDQEPGVRAIQLLTHAQGQLLEATEELRAACARADGCAARLRR